VQTQKYLLPFRCGGFCSVMNFTTVCLGLKSALDLEYSTLALRPVTYKYQGTTPGPVYCPYTCYLLNAQCFVYSILPALT